MYLSRYLKYGSRSPFAINPSLKAGVNERQFVDDAVALVSRYFGHYSAFRPGFVMDILKPESRNLKSVRSVFRVFSVFRGFKGF